MMEQVQTYQKRRNRGEAVEEELPFYLFGIQCLTSNEEVGKPTTGH